MYSMTEVLRRWNTTLLCLFGCPESFIGLERIVRPRENAVSEWHVFQDIGYDPSDSSLRTLVDKLERHYGAITNLPILKQIHNPCAVARR